MSPPSSKLPASWTNTTSVRSINDYRGWIGLAKRPETRRKRIDQMLDELKDGGVFMGMDHPPSRRA